MSEKLEDMSQRLAKFEIPAALGTNTETILVRTLSGYPTRKSGVGPTEQILRIRVTETDSIDGKGGSSMQDPDHEYYVGPDGRVLSASERGSEAAPEYEVALDRVRGYLNKVESAM